MLLARVGAHPRGWKDASLYMGKLITYPYPKFLSIWILMICIMNNRLNPNKQTTVKSQTKLPIKWVKKKHPLCTIYRETHWMTDDGWRMTHEMSEPESDQKGSYGIKSEVTAKYLVKDPISLVSIPHLYYIILAIFRPLASDFEKSSNLAFIQTFGVALPFNNLTDLHGQIVWSLQIANLETRQ